MNNYTDVNSQIVDNWVKADWEWGRPISIDAFEEAKKGNWQVVLTPLKAVPHNWFEPYYSSGSLNGAKLLGLASGGGQQMPIFAALGACCTVLDYSQAQLDTEKMIAKRHNYTIDMVRADIAKPLPFNESSFDIIFHPVSNFFIEDIKPLWHECYRILKPGGLLLAGMIKAASFLFDEDDDGADDKNDDKTINASYKVVNKLPFNPLKDPALYKKCIEKDWGIQFSHSLQEQIGGQLEAGFTLTHIFDDRSGGGIGDYFDEFFATRAVKA